MAKGRDRPKHQAKRKPKDKVQKIQPTSSYEPPMQQAEVVKPRRKPRSEPTAEE